MKRALLIVLCIVILIPVAAYAWFHIAYPRDIPMPAVTASKDPRVIARGAYLADHVNACAECHSERDWNAQIAPIVPGTVGKGGERMEYGVGDVVAPNITPFALGDWTDGEIARAIACGVDREGNALSPNMPYMEYRHLREEDLAALVSWVRTLDPIDGTPRKSKYDFPLSLIIRTMPDRYVPTKAPAGETPVQRGEYITRVAGCHHCHTPFEKGKYDEAYAFAGGHRIVHDHGDQITPNITMDEETGIGAWDEEVFIAMFRRYESDEARKTPVLDDGPTVMPWGSYSGMSDDDLRAVRAFLQTVPPVRHDPEAAGS